MNYKTCSNCGKTLPATTEYFHKNGNCKYGLNARCKTCRSVIRTERYANSPKYKRAARARAKEWALENPDRATENRHRHYIKHKDKIVKRVADWRKENPNKNREYHEKRRARINEAGGSHSAEDIQERMEEQGFMCFYCSEPLEDDYHVDHYYPISKGGSNDAENIVVACPSCNLSKNDKAPDEFMKLIGRTFVTA